MEGFKTSRLQLKCLGSFANSLLEVALFSLASGEIEKQVNVQLFQGGAILGGC